MLRHRPRPGDLAGCEQDALSARDYVTDIDDAGVVLASAYRARGSAGQT